MQKAQGSLEYLLIIGGGIIVAVVIIGSALFLTETGTEGTITGFAQGVCASHLGTDCYSQTFMIEDKEFACYLSDPNHCVAKSSDSIRFVQVTDTHLITGHTCEPNDPVDGRTDCYNNLVNYTDECSTGVCSWINPGTGMSIAPTIALQDAVEMVNEFNPDFVIVTGDLVAPSPCDTIKEESFALFKNIMNGLNTNYYVIGATSHDGVSNSICLEMFVDAFGENMKNWSFTRGKNLFIGLSETWETNNQLDLGYLELILNTYANQDMKVFIFFHTQISCYDEITGANFRCTNNPNLRTMLLAHQSEYKSVITIGGHNHANVYEQVDGIHFFTTTATMNYPVEFRIIDIEKDSVYIHMSGTINQAVEDLSYEIITNPKMSFQKNPLTFYGIESDREQFIDLSES